MVILFPSILKGTSMPCALKGGQASRVGSQSGDSCRIPLQGFLINHVITFEEPKAIFFFTLPRFFEKKAIFAV
jgi:hypothetical protein